MFLLDTLFLIRKDRGKHQNKLISELYPELQRFCVNLSYKTHILFSFYQNKQQLANLVTREMFKKNQEAYRWLWIE